MKLDRDRIPFLICAAFLGVVILEVWIVVGRMTRVGMPLHDEIAIYAICLAMLGMSIGAAAICWTRRAPNLSLWVLAFWWPMYSVEILGMTSDAWYYVEPESVRYVVSFMLSAFAVGYLIVDFATESRRRTIITDHIANPCIAALVVFVPWFGFRGLSRVAESTWIGNEIEFLMFSVYSVEFVCVLGYEWVIRTPVDKAT